MERRLVLGDARIVDHHGRNAQSFGSFGKRAFDASLLGDVHRHGYGAAAALFDLGGHRFCLLGAARSQRHPGAGRRQRAREMTSESARGAGDERDLVGEIKGRPYRSGAKLGDAAASLGSNPRIRKMADLPRPLMEEAEVLSLAQYSKQT